MLSRHQQLWTNLMSLVNSNEAFFYSDQQHGDHWYRIFNYRMCSYSDWLNPDALFCRGTMFEIDQEGPSAQLVRLACWPMHKFFNLGENPFVMDLDLSTLKTSAVKQDGSLISTYVQDDQLFLKSKGSLFSEQAIDAMRFLNQPENQQFKQQLLDCELSGMTVDMEWCSPDNRIVLGYDEPQLIVLSIRHKVYGDFVDHLNLPHDQIKSRFTTIVDFNDPIDFIESVRDMKGVEGFVCELDNGTKFKLKAEQYVALHRTKDNINSPRRLFEAVLEEATDDMKSLFRDDQQAITTIERMEQFVEKIYNHMVDQVERFYQRNKQLERKDYAILGKKELQSDHFGLAMMLYTGKQPDYKQHLKKQWKKLGLKDESYNHE